MQLSTARSTKKAMALMPQLLQQKLHLQNKLLAKSESRILREPFHDGSLFYLNLGFRMPIETHLKDKVIGNTVTARVGGNRDFIARGIYKKKLLTNKIVPAGVFFIACRAGSSAHTAQKARRKIPRGGTFVESGTTVVGA